MGFIKEFKEFAMRGNVMDMPVGIIIGTAFGKIVSSMVGDMIMPVVGALTGGKSFEAYSYTFGEGDAAATIKWGKFVQTVVDFLIVALVIFIMIKLMNRAQEALTGPEAEEEEKAPEIPEDIKLLTAIRDALKK